MKITSFNVNSIKTLRQYYPWNLTKSTAEIFDQLGADILCLQEVKLARLVDADIATPAGYDGYFSLSRSRAKGFGHIRYGIFNVGQIRWCCYVLQEKY